MQRLPLVKKKYMMPLLLRAMSTNERPISRHTFQNSRRTLFPRTRTGARTQNVGGQEVMQLRTAGLKVAPQLTWFPKWWREKQAKRISKMGKSAKAKIAEEAKGSTETANFS